MKPTKGDVHVNAILGNISVAFLQNAAHFVADKVFPNIPVQKQSDRYYVYDRGAFNRDEMKLRGPSTESAGVSFSLDNTPTYYSPVRSLHHDIDDQRRSNSDSVLAPDREATELLTGKFLINREKNFVSNYMATGKWTIDKAGVAAGPTGEQFLQFNDANSTPLELITAEKTRILESTGFEPNFLALGQQVWDELKNHPDIVDRVKYGQTAPGVAMVTTSAVAALLELDNIYVMKAIENTAKEGQTSSHSFIGGKTMLLGYAAKSPGLMTPTAGYHFSWTGFLGASPNGSRIKRFRIESITSDRIEIDAAYAQKLVSADLATFFATVVA